MRIRTQKTKAGGPGSRLTLVRAGYDPAIKRSRDVVLGSIGAGALPADVPSGVRLAEGQTLGTGEIEQLRRYLRPNGQALLARLPGLIQTAAQVCVERARDNKAAGRDRDQELERLVAAVRRAYEPAPASKNKRSFYEEMKRAGLIDSRSRRKRQAKEARVIPATAAPDDPA